MSKILQTPEETLRSQILGIKKLYFTPVINSGLLKITFDCLPVRKSIKSDLFFSISKNSGLKIEKFVNYSGIPELYDPKFDSWKLDFNVRADGIVNDIKIENEASVLDFSSLRTLKSFNDFIKEMYNKLLIDSFLIDYGTRDIIIDVFTFSKEVVKALEFIPFIRFNIIVKTDDSTLNVAELSIPYKYFKVVAEILSELKTDADFLFTLNKKPYVSKII